MKDSVGTKDQVSFILNGKPVVPDQKLECPLCGVDRLKQPCGFEKMTNAPRCPYQGQPQ